MKNSISLPKNYLIFIILTISILLLVQNAFGQHIHKNGETHLSCGQPKPTETQMQLLKKEVYEKTHKNTPHLNLQKKINGNNIVGLAINAITYIPIRLYILRNTNGSGGVNELEVLNGIADLNRKFRITNMQFYVCGTINYVNNTTFYDFVNTDEANLATTAGETVGVINIYYANTVTNGGNAVGGYAYLPGGAERIFIKNSQCNDGKTVSHEMGHIFGLLHTFNDSNNATITERELVTRGVGANCTTKGDFICDTPADPSDRTDCGTPTAGCTYIGTCTDANGAIFTPQMNNIMSYFFNCGTIFTTGQCAVINTTWENVALNRNYENLGRPSTTGCNSPTLASSPILSNTTSCNALGLTLTWSDITGEIGYFIERSSDAGSTFNTVGAVLANVTTFTDVTTTANTTYQYRIKPINSYLNFSNAISVTTCLTFCIPTYTQPCLVSGGTIGINSFSTTLATVNISNLNSACSANGYGDFSAIAGTFSRGNTINYSISNNIGGCIPQTHAIWIDFNGNGTFEGTSVGVGSEMIAQTMSAVGCTFNGTFTIPATATAGTYRMRVRSDGNSTATIVTNPCGNLNVGETEDYTAIISTTPNITVSTTTLTAFSACVGTPSVAQSYTVSATNLTENLVITPPANFEVSQTSAVSGFANTQTLVQNFSNLASTSIYIRQKAGATNGANGNITHTNTNGNNPTITIPTSTVTALPTISGLSVANITSAMPSFSLVYTTISNSPDQYSITTGAVAMAGFVPISNASLTASPLVIPIPTGSPSNIYNFNLTLSNSLTGCVSAIIPFTVTVNSVFITQWITADGTLTIPTFSGATYNYNVTYRQLPAGSITTLTGQTGNCTISGLNNGVTYEIGISGTFPRIHFGGSTPLNASKIINIKQWGANAWTSMRQAFSNAASGGGFGCVNLTSNATDAPNLAGVTDLSEMFAFCGVFNGNISNWNTTTITNMNWMFFSAPIFNQPISTWNVANVTDISYMFSYAYAFNQPIGNWNTTNMVNMSNTFAYAVGFNQNLANWNVTNAGVGLFTGLYNIFTDCGLNTANYDAVLISWALQNVPTGVHLGADNRTYCAAADARNTLITAKSWVITGDALACMPFITEWLTTDGNLTIPTTGTGYMYDVSYRELPAGLPTVLTAQTGNVTLTGLNNNVTYEISITGTFPSIVFGSSVVANRAKIRNIKQWGTNLWTAMNNAFLGCVNMNCSATDAPNLTSTTNMTAMFNGCTLFNGNIGHWDTGKITNMTQTFRDCITFNQPIGNWNTAKVINMTQIFTNATAFNQNVGNWNTNVVTNMSSMFRNATAFNQNIGNWNTSAVTNMSSMFSGATAFNQNVGNWNTSAVTNMGSIFFLATTFNQPIGNWNVTNVNNMANMFSGATAFNQNLGNWNTNANFVTNMSNMFSGATAFNQNLGVWNIANVTNMSGMLDNCGLNTTNYDATLISWGGQNVKTGVNLGSAGRTYCAGANARTILTNTKGWLIFGDIQSCMTISVNTLPTFIACAGSPSIAQSYTISGSNLIDNIIITSPSTSFEISQTSATLGFAPSQTLIQVGGNVATTTIYIRLSATAINTPTQNITHTTGIVIQNISVNSNVSPAYITSVSVPNISNFDTAFLLNYTTTNLDLYSITTGTGNIMPDFVPISNNALTGSPLVIPIPAGSLPKTYNFNLTASSSTTGCIVVVPFTVTVIKPFVIEVVSPLFGGNNFVIKTHPSETYNYTVSYGFVGNTQRTVLTGQTGDCTITSLLSGFNYEITITGLFPRIYMGGSTAANCAKLTKIKQWGTNAWTSMEQAFGNATFGCKNLTSDPIDSPNLTNVTSFRQMFARCSLFNGNVTSWNTANITDMSGMFQCAFAFNRPIGLWNTTSVTNMSNMFAGSITGVTQPTTFNQPIANWNTNNVTNMSGMFKFANAFNQPIANWNTANVTNMSYMFQRAEVFNQPIGNWNTANVTNMSYMFQRAFAFNQPIGNWITNNVTNIEGMFNGATVFNQPIGNWNTANVTSMGLVFANATTFNQPIGNWNTANVLTMGSMFSKASTFNQPIGTWNTSNVGFMQNMFQEATAFNQPIGTWNTGNVQMMDEMFLFAPAFNQPLNTWNTSSVISMSKMFNLARSFNQPIGSWNTINVKNMYGMFSGATAFNQPLGTWNITNVAYPYSNTGMENMLDNCAMSIANYDATLIGWAGQAVQSGIKLGAVGRAYCISALARATLTSNPNNWIIIGDVSNCIAITAPSTNSGFVPSLFAFSTCAGAPSVAQSYTVSGSNLTENIVLTRSSNYWEISQTSATSGFAPSQTLIQTSGVVPPTTIYVRQTVFAINGANGSITHTSAGMTGGTGQASNLVLMPVSTVNSLPTIVGVSAPSVSNAVNTFNLNYTSTTGTPDLYSVTTGTTAMAGFVPINDAILGTLPLAIPIPSGVAPNTYNFNLIVRNATTGCISNIIPFTLNVTAGSLPITLLSFTGKRTDENNVLLQWKTATELNNKGFEIESSENSTSFTKIAFVDGAGNSTNIRNYQFNVQNSDNTYYRLKQIDFDGRFSYSNIIFVKGSENKVSIYPNPSNENINIKTSKEGFIYEIFTLQGNSLIKNTATSNTTNVNIKSLPKGIYFVHIIQNNNRVVKKIVVE